MYSAYPSEYAPYINRCGAYAKNDIHNINNNDF